MKTIHLQQLRLAICQLSFILMVALPLVTFPADSIYGRYLPDILAFTGLGFWGLLTTLQPETKKQALHVNGLGMLTGFWALLIAAQYVFGLIPTSVAFTLLGIGYLLSAMLVGMLVRIWVNAGFEHELLHAFLLAVGVVAVLNATVILIQASPWIKYVVPFIEQGNPNRPGGIISQANIAGTWCVCGLIALVFLSQGSNRTAAPISAWRMAVMVWLLLAINISMSRIVLLEVVAVSVLCAVFKRKLQVHWVWSWLPLWQALIHYSLKYLWHVFQPLKHFSDANIYQRFTESNQSRIDIYSAVIETIKEHPLVGIGWRQFQWVHISRPELDTIFDHAHNLLLHIQLELGLAGSLSLLAFFIYAFKQTHIWSTEKPSVAVGLMMALVFGMHSMTEYPLWYAPSLFAFCVAVAFVFDKPVVSFKCPAWFFQVLFALHLSVVVWVYMDHKHANEKLGKFITGSSSPTSPERPSFWFKTYDDFIEVNGADIRETNVEQYQNKVINLTNFLTPAIPLHNLLKIYVFSHQEEKAKGLAERICRMNPALWQKILVWHLTQGPDTMKKWILDLNKDVIDCESAHPH